MDVLITGVKPGRLVADIACHVENADEPTLLHVEAEIKVSFTFKYVKKLNWYLINAFVFKGPEIQIKEAAVDFGLVQMGNKVKSFVTVENISNLPLRWHLSCLEYQVSILSVLLYIFMS
jgi:hypothetical protein